VIVDEFNAWLANFPPEWRAVFEPESAVPLEAGHVLSLKAWLQPFVYEAGALREALQGKSFLERTRHIERHPPSAGAIAMLTVVSEQLFASKGGSKAADARHEKNRKDKATARAYYAEHRHEFKNKDEAAEAIATNLKQKWATVREWLREPKKVGQAPPV